MTTLYFYIEVLEAKTFLNSIWPTIRAAMERKPEATAKVFIVDSKPCVYWLAKKTLSSDNVQIERLAFSAAKIFDEQKTLIWLRLYYRDMAEVLGLVTNHSVFSKFLKDPKASIGLQTYVKKQVLPGTTMFSGNGLWRSMFLVQVALWKTREDNVPETNATLFLLHQPWIDSIRDYARKYGDIKITCVGQRVAVTNTLRRLVGRDLLIFSQKIFRLGAFYKTSQSTEVITPCLALQYYGHFNLNEPHRYSDFFFWQQSDFPATQILALFNIPKDPLNVEKLAALSKHGMRSLALRYDAAVGPNANRYAGSTLLSNFASAMRLISDVTRPAEAVWLKGQKFAFQSQKSYWKRLFERQRVKVFLTWFKYNGEHCAISEALHELDGTLAVYQRSYEGNSTVQSTVLSDVYFGFGRNGPLVEANSGSIIDYYVITGYLGDHRFQMVRDSARLVRNTLLSNGATYIAAYFDESSFPDARWGIDDSRLQEHYAFLLDRLLTEPEFGLIIKPKTPGTLFKRLGSVGRLLNDALKTDRCHVFWDGSLQGSTPPCQAALSADLAIHSSVSSGTAAVEAALAGVPTVLFDDDGWKVSPLYRLGKNVVYEDWNSLWAAWRGHRKSPGLVENFADWSSILDDLDPFRDGRAAERMGTFLKWTMTSLLSGASRDEALDQASERYVLAWGEDKIVRVRPRHFA